MINYITIESAAETLSRIEESAYEPHVNGVFVFKHSPRCIISKMVKSNLEQEWQLPAEQYPVFLVDVINNRAVSNQLAQRYEVNHESPQLLFIKNNSCVGNASHHNVSIKTVNSWLQ